MEVISTIMLHYFEPIKRKKANEWQTHAHTHIFSSLQLNQRANSKENAYIGFIKYNMMLQMLSIYA